MISRKSAMAIANAYMKKFSFSSSSAGGKVYRENFYDYLYEYDYEAWFCNMVKKIFKLRDLKEWLLKIHTGESFATATPSWTWEQRSALGQVYLKNLACDFIAWYRQNGNQWNIDSYKGVCEEMIRRLEIDGYLFQNGELRQAEIEVLDVEAEKGLLESLHAKLALTDREQTFGFLKLSEDHYVAGRWSDCIGNSRKFFESVLQQVANQHSTTTKNTPLTATTLTRPVAIRDYLETEALLEKKEREAVDKIYGLLSHTGGHPYMAEEDQARLLRQICLTMTQFVMLRLEGALQKRGF